MGWVRQCSCPASDRSWQARSKVSTGTSVSISLRAERRLILFEARLRSQPPKSMVGVPELRRARTIIRSKNRRNANAVCANQDAQTTKRADAPSHAPSVNPAADLGDQCDPGSRCRLWRHRSGLTQRHRGITADNRRSERQTGARCCARVSCRTGQPIAQSKKADLGF
jgi:hypothetical protein